MSSMSVLQMKFLFVEVFKLVQPISCNRSNHVCTYYMKEVFEYASQGAISLRNNCAKLKVPFQKINMRHKSLSYIGPSIMSKLPSSVKRSISSNTFKYDVKKTLITRIKKN